MTVKLLIPSVQSRTHFMIVEHFKINHKVNLHCEAESMKFCTPIKLSNQCWKSCLALHHLQLQQMFKHIILTFFIRGSFSVHLISCLGGLDDSFCYIKISSYCHSSVDLSAPTILLPRVQVPSTPAMHFSIIVCVLYLSCEKNENKQKEADRVWPIF